MRVDGRRTYGLENEARIDGLMGAISRYAAYHFDFA